MVTHFNNYDPSEEKLFLEAMVDTLPTKEIEDYFLDEEADSYLSSLEAQHPAFCFGPYSHNTRDVLSR